MRNVTACIVLIAGSWLSSALAQQQQSGRVLSLADVRALIGIPTPDTAIVLAIKARGLDFVPTDELVDGLHALGAGPGTENALRDLVPRATLTIESEIPDCEVFVDGQIRGRTGADGRLKVANLALRNYEVVVRRTDYADFSKHVTLAIPGTTVQAKLVSDRPANVEAALAKWRSLNAQLLDIESDYRQRMQRAAAAVEAPYDDAIATVGTSTPAKDAFETTRDYEARVAKHDEQVRQINARRQSEVARIRANYEAERIGATARLQRTLTLIESGYYPGTGGPSPNWRSYDADRSELWIGLDNTLLTCRVPPPDARIANASRDKLQIESRYRFATSGLETQGSALLMHPAFSEPKSCERVDADRFAIELKGLLDGKKFDSFRKQATFALDLGAGTLLRLKLLHQHIGPMFHEALVVIGPSGIYFDPKDPRERGWQPGLIAMDRIREVQVQHVLFSPSAIMLHIGVNAATTSGKRTELNFVTLNTTKDGDSPFWTSPSGAVEELREIAWLIDQVRSRAASNHSQ